MTVISQIFTKKKYIRLYTEGKNIGRIRLLWSNDIKKEKKLKLYNSLFYVLQLTIILTNLLHNLHDVKCPLFIL